MKLHFKIKLTILREFFIIISSELAMKSGKKRIGYSLPRYPNCRLGSPSMSKQKCTPESGFKLASLS